MMSKRGLNLLRLANRQPLKFPTNGLQKAVQSVRGVRVPLLGTLSDWRDKPR